jgi:3-oxoacyl-[acyl-carrier protein] reductase
MITIDLSNQVALVTGASRGLGAAILETLCGAGALGLLNYLEDGEGKNRADAEEVRARIVAVGGQCELQAADVSDAEQVRLMMGRIARTHGRLDILVNNAGILRDRTIRNMTPDEWEAVIDTNLGGVFYGCKYGMEIMADGGRIVSLSSVSAYLGTFGQANYAAAKAGVTALTRVVGREGAKRGIRANAVAPGLILTPMAETIPQESRDRMLPDIPLGRFGEPSDVAGVVLFLCSPLSAYVTGQVIHVNGGRYG